MQVQNVRLQYIHHSINSIFDLLVEFERKKN